MSKEPRLVETTLPRDYLLELGVYLQTCAQIEYYACSAICVCKNLRMDCEEGSREHIRLRGLPTSKLIKELKTASKQLVADESWRNYFNELAEFLKKYVADRHAAVHGHHSLSSDGSSIVVSALSKDKKSVQEQRVHLESIKEPINNADRILRALLLFLDSR